MNAIAISIFALVASMALSGDFASIQENIFPIASGLLASLLGAGAVVHFRPEPTIAKGITKTLWSTALGVILAWNLTEAMHIVTPAHRIGIYVIGGLSSLIVIQSLVMALENKVPEATGDVVGFGLNKLKALLGVTEGNVKVTEATKTETTTTVEKLKEK